MPNHIKNVIKAPQHVLDKLLVDNGDNVDFNNVIPCPFEWKYDGVMCNAESLCESLMKFDFNPNDIMSRLRLSSMMNDDVRDLNEEGFNQFIEMVRNLKTHGFMHPTHFNREKWGTKWNGYSCESDEGVVSFETAWSHPEPVMIELSKLYPDDEIEVKYADEDIGNNLGWYVIKNGEKIYINKIPNKNEFAMKLHYGDDIKPEDYKYDENWEYIEE